MKRPFQSVFALLAAVAVFTAGCEVQTDEGDEPVKPAASAAANSNTKSGAAPTATAPAQDSTTPDATGAVPADQVDFGALHWTCGGVNGSGASPSGVSISGLRISGSNLSFSYRTNLSAWGYSSGDASAYACLFVQKADGSWSGGKFDWISSSRSSRGLENVLHGYGGWNLNGVPNPCPAAFVIVDSKSKRRSNVIAGTWKR